MNTEVSSVTHCQPESCAWSWLAQERSLHLQGVIKDTLTVCHVLRYLYPPALVAVVEAEMVSLNGMKLFKGEFLRLLEWSPKVLS